MKIYRALLVPVLLACTHLLISTDGNCQIRGRSRLGCKDSYNYALLYYNKGQFERISDLLVNCMDEIERDRERYRDDEDLRPLVFKVYKIIINSYRNLDQEKQATLKKNELINLFYGVLNKSEVEKILYGTELTEIK